jgi:hypothetical protein
MMISERIQALKTTDYMIPFMWIAQNRQIHGDVKQISGCCQMGEWTGNDCNLTCRIIWGDGDVKNYKIVMAA